MTYNLLKPVENRVKRLCAWGTKVLIHLLHKSLLGLLCAPNLVCKAAIKVLASFYDVMLKIRLGNTSKVWSATYSSSLTKPIQKIQVILVDILENLVKNDSIVAEHGLSSKITQSPGRSSDTSKGSENSGSFEDMVRSDCKEYSEDGSILQGREALRLLTQGTKITESLCSVKEPSYVGALNDTSTQHKNEGFQLASWAGRKPRVQFEEKYIRIKASTKTMCSDYEAIDALRSSVLGYVAYSDCKTTSMGNTKSSIHLVKNLKFFSWAKLVRILISEGSLSLLKILVMKSLAAMFTRLVMKEKLKFWTASTGLRVN
ncbi:hypothetical protein Tco_0952127 [Tanacetum coccineum]|uniref:Uncharacterized protein n=1 Tax=Tanacetum coccineum TaxID=301880 RepID=A0ABQ5DYH0_9ASTR